MAFEINEYKIRLDFDLKNFTYRGDETISVKGSKEDISLDAVGMEIESVSVNEKNARFRHDGKVLKIEERIDENSSIEIKFHAKVSDTLMGLYLSSTKEGKMITTQFESTGARQAFPCVDDPSYKAAFSITLVIDEDYDAISNMPVKKTEIGKRKMVEFEKTPRMSTYLVYIGIGKFKYEYGKYGDKDIILTSLKEIKSKFPIEIAKGSIGFYEKYFGIEYALPKMHLISVPEFGAGAMENWGAITFRETALMATENSGSIMKESATVTIAHEIAHQWFGDLVTMKWWNDLWLNESFATFMSYKVTNSLFPEWDAWSDFIRSETGGAMRSDSLDSSHPIEVDVKDPDEISQIFDEISYGKGASILRMIENYVGEEDFRKGISSYLKENEFGNAEGSYLWNSIEKASSKPVKKIMEYWIKNKGYPVIETARKGDSIELKQRTFLLNGKKESGKWPIPLTIMTHDGVKSDLMEKDKKIDGFIKLNVDNSGFYRVLYDNETFSGIMKEYTKLSNLDKWGLLNDLYAFLLSGYISIKDYREKISNFMDDTDHLVIEELSSQLYTLFLIKPESSTLKKDAIDYISGNLKRLGEKVKGEDDKISMIRGILASYLAGMDDAYAKEISARMPAIDADPDLASAIAIAVARTGGIKPLEEAMSKYTADEITVRIVSAMGWVNPQEMDRIFDLIDNNVIKKQDMLMVFRTMPMNPAGRDVFFRNIDRIVSLMEHAFEGTGYTSRILEGSLPLIALTKYDEAKAKAKQLKKPDTEMGINKALELMDIYSRLYREL